MSGPAWPDERIEALKGLVADGLTSGQAAKELGVTRNAVIGMARRLEFKWKGPPCGKGRTRTDTPPKPYSYPKGRHRPGAPKPESTLQSIFRQAGEATDLSPEKSESRNVGFFELGDHQCKWPSGDPSMIYELRFCGAGRLGSLPYCKYHTYRAYRPAADVRRERVQVVA